MLLNNYMQVYFARFSRHPVTMGCKTSIILFVSYGFFGDIYVSYLRAMFPAEEGQMYRVAYEQVRQKKPIVYASPDQQFPNFSPFSPNNGDTVCARTVRGKPDWVEMQSGRFLPKRMHGVNVLIRLDQDGEELDKRLLLSDNQMRITKTQQPSFVDKYLPKNIQSGRDKVLTFKSDDKEKSAE